jgi:phage tail sheath protein FI
MPFLSPGVYVLEVPSAAAPIAGVGTSTAGFVGLVTNEVVMPFKPGRPLDPNHIVPEDRYPIAPANEPQLITNWEEFKKSFGNVQDGNRVLANAVYGFFNNGGTRCWVTRVTSLMEDTTHTPAVDPVADALAGFEAIDEIAIVAVPTSTSLGAGEAAANLARRVAVRELVLSHCERMEDRFAIVDGEESVDGELTPPEIYPNAAGNARGRNSNYGAVYFPWIDIGEKNANGDVRYMPPSGHIAGIYARVDTNRGVHKAPANEPIRGALGLKYRLSRSQQDGLNPDGINAIRQFNGNITVWGARTIGGDANITPQDFRFVSVRRLFNFLRESIDEGTQWVVFEPNTPNLWAKITRNVTAFLTNVWRSGALFGTTPQEAFYVKCDAETNPPEIRDAGQVVTEIGVAVVKPAEFVIFRISQWAGPGS